ncbi:MAG TPA: NAD(P)-binding domain-containing protein [Candidatus Binataceae bacterium]|nr:NAD(P)-binding domain-containing protein [Candidatus Binataceae bacterium]
MTRRLRWILSGWAALILLALLTVPRASYQPGRLLAAHSRLDSKCVGCHRPWRGVDNSQCIACHGDFTNNPHNGYYVFDDKDGLISGRHLATFKDNLSCLSCHSEHRGRDADFSVQAAFACTWCHQHPTIAAVNKHDGATLARHASANQMFNQPFNHYQHRLLMTLQASNFPNGFDCAACHQVTAVAPGAVDKMTIAWRPCGFCHANPQVPSLALPAALGKSPAALPYSGVVRTLHVNAVFNHSKSHLQTPCAQCHLKVSESAKPDDANSLLVSQCFSCHAHQEQGPAQTRQAAKRGSDAVWFAGFEAVAIARETQSRVVACGQCHRFHTHGPVPLVDFTKPALKTPPGVHASGAFRPWGIGVAAILLVGLCGVAYTVFLPATEEHRAAVMETAPQRIIETPVLDDTYQTSIQGLYIIGEMGGTASINLAMRSGRQVIEAIAESFKHSAAPAQPDLYDVMIVGCGPAGLGATATAKAHGLSYVTLERMTPASTLRTYPRAKFVQATPIDILEYGSFFLEGDSTREDLIREWDKIISQAGLVINDREEVVGIDPHDGYFTVRTAQGHDFKARCVVLAIGLRGHPRRLGIQGEAPGRVHYQLIEPDDFRNQRILVVGGGNAGAEVTQALAAPHLGNKVSYSIRDEVLSKVTHENGEKIIALQRAGTITLYAATEVKQIKEKTVVLQPVKRQVKSPDGRASASEPVELDNDLVFAMLGAELPTRFLESIGIKMEVKHR